MDYIESLMILFSEIDARLSELLFACDTLQFQSNVLRKEIKRNLNLAKGDTHFVKKYIDLVVNGKFKFLITPHLECQLQKALEAWKFAKKSLMPPLEIFSKLELLKDDDVNPHIWELGAVPIVDIEPTLNTLTKFLDDFYIEVSNAGLA